MTEQIRTIDATPDTSMLLALCETSFTWRKALAELIDNSIDAGATEVTIEFGSFRKKTPGSCTVCDNGKGTDEIRNFFCFGGRSEHTSTKLGRYGVGAKDACLWIGKTDSVVSVQTVNNGQHHHASVCWKDLIDKNNWDITETSRPARAGEIGTVVEVSPVKRTLKNGTELDELLDNLGYMYTGAIEAGRSITFYGLPKRSSVALRPYHLPPLEPDEVDATIEVLGRAVRVRAGVVREGEPNRRPGLTYVHAFRVIKSACGDGLGGGSIGRIAGTVTLNRDWPLTKNKDDISDGEELYDAVAALLLPLTQRAEKSRMVVETAALCSDLAMMLNEGFGINSNPDSKAKRGDGEEGGTKEPKNTGRKHKRAQEAQPGQTFRRRGGFRVEFAPLGTTETTGYFSSGTVILNTSHPIVPVMQREGSRRELMLLIAPIAAHAEVYEGARANPRQARLPLLSEDDAKRYHERVAKLLAVPARIDGEDVYQAAAE